MNRRNFFGTLAKAAAGIVAAPLARFIPVAPIYDGIDRATYQFWRNRRFDEDYETLDVTRIDVFDKAKYQWKFIDGNS